MVDPGFPVGNHPDGAPAYDFANFFEKLHEIENILAGRGRPRVRH